MEKDTAKEVEVDLGIKQSLFETAMPWTAAYLKASEAFVASGNSGNRPNVRKWIAAAVGTDLSFNTAKAGMVVGGGLAGLGLLVGMQAIHAGFAGMGKGLFLLDQITQSRNS